MINMEGFQMNKTVSISIRVNEEEMERIRLAARLEEYASYSEFIRRTVLIEAKKIIAQKEIVGGNNE